MRVDAGVLLLRKWLTIEEAAQLIAAGSGCKRKECEDLLIEAIEAGALVPVRFARVEVIDYFDGNHLGRIDTMATTVQRADLDAWCQKMGLALPGGKIGQASDEAAATDPAKPKPVRQQQEDAILQVIAELRYTATALPKTRAGKRGVKAEVRTLLVPGITPRAFDKTWQGLLDDGRMAYAADGE
jgi:hypothetical protein